MKVFLLFLVIVLILPVITSQCHYSCALCSGPYYTKCITCSNPLIAPSSAVSCGNNLDQKYLSQIGGICGSGAYSGVNALGIVLIMLSIIASFWLQSRYVFSFVISLQTLGLMSLMETDFSPSLDYLVNSLEYFMLFSVIQKDLKYPNCKLMLKNMYRLNNFLGTINFRQNSIPIMPLAIVAASLLAFGSFIAKYRKNKLPLLEEKTWNKVLDGLRAFLFFTMQQAVLVSYVGIRFGGLDGGLIMLVGIYWAWLIYLMVDCNLHMPKTVFGSTVFMNVNFVKRLILPVLAVVPYDYTFCIIIFLIAFSVIDLLLFIKAKRARLKSVVYQVLELSCVAIIGGFLLADLGNNSERQVSTLGILGTVFLAAYILFFLVEIIIAMRKRLNSSKVTQAIDSARKSCMAEKNSQDTLSDLNSNENQRQTKVTPAESSRKKVTDDLNLSKKPMREIRVQEFT